MTSATERLRALLDERRVMWGNIRNDGSESDFFTEWQFDGVEGHAIATEWSAGNLTVCIAHPMTPEQAVAATLGPGTCRALDGESSSGAPLQAGDYDEFWEPAGVCSECGELIPLRNYCPNCGRKVVE